jgi:aspartyl-tRNA synthetase
MILRNTTNIRDVIAFPKTQSGADLMCGAPSPIEDKQLREANIRLAQIVKAEPKITEQK